MMWAANITGGPSKAAAIREPRNLRGLRNLRAIFAAFVRPSGFLRFLLP